MSKSKELEESLSDVLRRDNHREYKMGEYHPSTITGCPLKAVLDAMVDSETRLNKWLFQGTAVHYYLQEAPSPSGYDGVITEALHNAGYHPIDTDYEVSIQHKIGDGASITGTCDIITTHEDGDLSIFDIKYSSVKPSTHQGRLMSYFSQVNCYSNMFGADYQGLILIDNNEKDSIPDNGITVVDGEPVEDNWEIQKQKARAIHSCLEQYGYGGGERWSMSMLESADLDFWQGIMETVNSKNCPSYEKECRYCDYKEFCPVKQGEIGKGLNSFKGGVGD